MSVRENFISVSERKDAAAVRSGRDRDDVLLVAVTKTHGPEEINEAISAGATDIGENKVQEILEKYDKVKPVRWHMIGHLQRNKVKSIIDKVVMIHSVDSVRLAEEIDKRAKAAGIVMDVLLQVNIGDEASKTGAPVDEFFPMLDEIMAGCRNVRVRGLMCVPPAGDSPEDAREYFARARQMFEKMKTLEYDNDLYCPDTLSMGMSGDFEVAIEEGSTLVRVGSSIFGRRNYR